MAAVWNWREGSGRRTTSEPSLPSWGFFALQVLIPSLVGFWLYRRGHLIFPGILWTIVTLVLAGRLFAPPLYRAFHRFGEALSHAVSIGLTWGLLVPVFYLIFGTARLGLLIRRRDPMARACPTEATTYWHPRAPIRNIRQYERQH